MARKKKVEEVPREPRLRTLLNQKLIDVSSTDDGWSILHFSNNFKLKVKGNVFLVVEPA